MHVITNSTQHKEAAIRVEYDNEGFLVDRYDWGETLAHDLARKDGIPVLTAEHWQVIFYIRDYYNSFEVLPSPRRVCQQLGRKGYDISAMFGNCLNACRIAGLPNPGEAIKEHLN